MNPRHPAPKAGALPTALHPGLYIIQQIARVVKTAGFKKAPPQAGTPLRGFPAPLPCRADFGEGGFVWGLCGDKLGLASLDPAASLRSAGGGGGGGTPLRGFPLNPLFVPRSVGQAALRLLNSHLQCSNKLRCSPDLLFASLVARQTGRPPARVSPRRNSPPG